MANPSRCRREQSSDSPHVPVVGDATQVGTNYPDLARVVQPGARLLLDDGAIELSVEETTDTDVVCRIINGGLLGERKGINLPGISLPIASLTEKDIEDLNWAVTQDVDYIALSFVRRAEDCVQAKSLINKVGWARPSGSEDREGGGDRSSGRYHCRHRCNHGGPRRSRCGNQC